MESRWNTTSSCTTIIPQHPQNWSLFAFGNICGTSKLYKLRAYSIYLNAEPESNTRLGSAVCQRSYQAQNYETGCEDYDT